MPFFSGANVRRDRLFLLAVLSAALTIPASGQARVFLREPRPPRAWLVLSDGAGPSGGGLSSQTGLIQLFRVSGTVVVTPTLGIEVSGLRIQEILPAKKLFNDPALNNPKADGVVVALASLTREGRNRFPATLSLGGGVMRRPTNDPTKTRLTGGFQAGIETSIWRPRQTDRVDGTAGARLILLPAGSGHKLYMLALTFGLRLG